MDDGERQENRRTRRRSRRNFKLDKTMKVLEIKQKQNHDDVVQIGSGFVRFLTRNLRKELNFKGNIKHRGKEKTEIENRT